ncbi:class I SAM-dependent methyltransferase [Candidatus Zixiibacteriota bacterium]
MKKPPRIEDVKHQRKIMAEVYDRQSSEFYDYHAKRADVEFYVGFAAECGGAVLEIGCGTGRLLIPSARAGVQITGLDNSEEMLAMCRRKLADESSEVRGRVNLVGADMRDFDLGSKFSLVTIPFGPFNYLASVEEHIRCLNCIWRHLDHTGALVMDLWYPNLRELSASEDGAEIVSVKTPFHMPDGRSVLWGIRNTSVDYNRQIIQEEMFYDIRYPDGHAERLVYPSPVRYFFRYEVEHLLARTGFRTEAVYASFDKEPFGSKYPSELVFLARKASEQH